MTEETDGLPTGFKKISKIAMHCAWGVILLFFAFKSEYVTKGLSPKVVEWVNLFLIVIGIPCVILSGAGVLKLIKITRFNDK